MRSNDYGDQRRSDWRRAASGRHSVRASVGFEVRAVMAKLEVGVPDVLEHYKESVHLLT